ncbi:MAG TPA: sulfatase-like hydrolase/transferase, partial [Candidatus Brocadiia bacterium]|nr:sulfatase-like hydrolase/transferase [Candidatus Brocadiia bacterium]
EAFLDKAARSGRPFFLWLSIPDPHPPYTAPAPWCDMFRPEDMPAPARREGELDSLPPHYRRLYETGVPTAGRIAPTRIADDARQRAAAMVCGMAAQFDAMAGRVMKRLEELGLGENTVTVFMSDHGQMLGDHWMFSMPPSHLDGSLRVPCIWRFPGRFPAGRVCSGLASHLDFAPTVLDLAGVAIPEGPTPPAPEAPGQRPPWPGRSLRPMLTGEAESVQESVIAENDEDYLGLRLRTLITQDYHITLYAGERYGEMFDLRRDPRQLHNLWDEPGALGLRNSLLAQLADRFAQTDSVLPRRMGHA